MKLKKRVTLIGTTLIMVVLLMSCNRDRSSMHEKIPEMISKMSEKFADKLDLTAPQKVKFDLLVNEVKKDLNENLISKKKSMRGVYENLKKENPAVRTTLESIKNQMTDQKGMMDKKGDKYIDLFMNFYDTLNKEQQNEIIEFITEKLEDFI